MSGKRRHAERQAFFQRLREREHQGALARGVGIDTAALAPYGGYGAPDFVARGYYTDQPFLCRGCGIPQTWTAEQQKWWYEVAKGHVFSTATLCRACRRRRRDQQLQGGDPNPIKSVGSLLAALRSRLEPSLQAAGYGLFHRSPREAKRLHSLDYQRSDDLLTISFDQWSARLTAESLSGAGADLRLVAVAELSQVGNFDELMRRVEPFLESIREFVLGSNDRETL